jgi:type III pantothenate kinase
MHLIIDQGNTTTKYFIVNANNEIVFHTALPNIEVEKVCQLTAEYNVQLTLVSSVRTHNQIIKAELGEKDIFYFDEDSQLPVTNLYATPKTLGKDRIAAVCGAAKLYPNKNCLVIDAGTCITYDFIDSEKKYYGGSISPGLEMRLKAMHTFTGKLPQAPLQWAQDFIGNSTESSLQSGALQGAVNEIDGFVSRYKKRFGTITTIMCGGNTDFLANRCESKIFAAPNLVITGLNQILKHNLPHGA